MQINEALLHDALTNAETRAIKVFNHSKEHSGAERSGIYALGHYEGLKEAVRLLVRQGHNSLRAAFVVPTVREASSSEVYPPFATIFQKLRHTHGPKVLGSW
jgi:hypothetical protein